jgi:hypothetical protein
LGLEVLQRDYPNSEWTKKAQVYALIPWNNNKRGQIWKGNKL